MPSLLLESLFPLVFIMLLGWLSGKLGYTRREDASVLYHGGHSFRASLPSFYRRTEYSSR